MRFKLLILHRYIGLSLAIFLILSGLTGSVIAFQDRLEVWLNPTLFVIDEVGQESLSASELVTRIEASDTRIRVTYLPITRSAKYALVSYIEARTNPQTNELFEVDYDEVFINPVTGEILGKRLWGKCCFEPENIIPFFYKLHNRLLLPKPWGSRIMGFVALLWVLMSVLGIYLTMPRGKQFFKKWKNSWKVQWKHPWRIKTIQLHKSIGLWCSVLMLSSALSGLSMNLEKELFTPMVQIFSSYTDKPIADESEFTNAAIDFSLAITKAINYAEQQQLPVEPKVVKYSSTTNRYQIELDHKNEYSALGATTVFIGGGSGEVLGVTEPSGDTAADFLAAVRLPLHSGKIFGTVGPFLVSFVGLMTVLLVILGVSMWLRKRLN